jgi:hypothetical protein
MTLRINEANGNPFEHILAIKEGESKLDVLT